MKKATFWIPVLLTAAAAALSVGFSDVCDIEPRLEYETYAYS